MTSTLYCRPGADELRHFLEASETLGHRLIEELRKRLNKAKVSNVLILCPSAEQLFVLLLGDGLGTLGINAFLLGKMIDFLAA